MKCPHCQLLLDVPSEVERGTTIGICSGCGKPFGPASESQANPRAIDRRGEPSKPGAGQPIIWEAA